MRPSSGRWLGQRRHRPRPAFNELTNIPCSFQIG